jgi:hypothetical protein
MEISSNTAAPYGTVTCITSVTLFNQTPLCVRKFKKVHLYHDVFLTQCLDSFKLLANYTRALERTNNFKN